MEVQVRPPTRKLRCSLLTLLTIVTIVTAICSAVTWLNVSIRDTQRAAHLAGQERELHEIGASFVAAQEPPHMVSEIDFTATGVDQPWLQKRLGYWEYSSAKSIRLRRGQIDHKALAELRVMFPQIDFTEELEMRREGRLHSTDVRGQELALGGKGSVQLDDGLRPAVERPPIARQELPPPDSTVAKRVEELVKDGDSEAARQLSELFQRAPSRWLAERGAACLARHKRYEAAPLLLRYAMLGDESATVALEQMEVPETVSAIIIGAVLAGKRFADEEMRVRLERLLGEDAGVEFSDWERLYVRLEPTLKPPIPEPVRRETRRVLEVMAAYDKAAFATMAIKDSARLPAPRPPDFTVRTTGELEQSVRRYVEQVQVLTRTRVTADGRLQVDLYGTSLTREELAFLAGFRPLDMLDLGHTNIGDEELRRLPPMQGLAMLGLADTRITEAGFLSLEAIDGLRSVDLEGTAVGDAAVERLATRCDLEVLAIGRTSVTDRGLAVLRDEASLRSLHLNGTAISDNGIRLLRHLRSIEELVLTDTSVSDASMVYLADMPKLSRLWADETEVTAHGIGRLAGMRFEIMSLRGLRVPNGDIKPLLELDLAGELVLERASICDEAMTDLLSMSRLTLLSVGRTQITGKGISSASVKGYLRQLRNLKTLVLDDTQVDDEGMARLRELPNLRILSAKRTRISAKGVAECVSLPLETLYLDGTDVGDEVLPSLGQMPKLRYLSLAATAVSDKGVPDLLRMRSIEELVIWGTRLSSDAVAELRRGLPGTKIIFRRPE